MNTTYMRRYQEQAIASASPQQLVAKLYDLGIGACHADNRAKVRAVLVELVSSLDMEKGGDVAARLYALYQYCMEESMTGDLGTVCTLFEGLREAWREGVLARRAA